MGTVSASQKLVSLFWSPASEYKEKPQQQAEQFDKFEPRFSSRLLELCTAMGEDRTLARRSIRNALNRDYTHTEPEDWKDAAQEIIHSTLWDYSLSLLDEYRNRQWNRVKGHLIINKADAFVKTESPELYPDFYSDSLSAIQSYCQSIGIAAYILAGDTMQDTLRQETRSFVEWVGEDTHRLDLARRCKIINLEDLNELWHIMRETHSSLDEGVL